MSLITNDNGVDICTMPDKSILLVYYLDSSTELEIEFKSKEIAEKVFNKKLEDLNSFDLISYRFNKEKK